MWWYVFLGIVFFVATVIAAVWILKVRCQVLWSRGWVMMAKLLEKTPQDPDGKVPLVAISASTANYQKWFQTIQV